MSPFAAINPEIAAEVRFGNLNVPPPITRTATGELKSRFVNEATVGVPAPEPINVGAVTFPVNNPMLAPRLPTFALPVTLNVPPVLKLPAVAVAVTVKETRVPTDVIFGCAAVVTVPAVGTVPDTLAP